MLLPGDLVLWDKELNLNDKADVGDDLALLGELSEHKVNVLPQIVITPQAFKVFLKDNNLDTQIKHLLGSLNHERHDSLTQVTSYIRRLITHAPIHKDIINPLYKKIEKLETKKLKLTATYRREKSILSSHDWEIEGGEAVLAEKIREAWADLFTPGNLKRHSLHHENHHTFSTILVVAPELSFDLQGHIKTGHKIKGEFEIEAHEAVRFHYNKHSKKITQGHILPGGDKNALSANDIKVLLSYAHACEKAVYMPQKLSWIKFDGTFFVTKVGSVNQEVEFKDTYNSLIENITVHPGITIGRLQVIDEKSQTTLVVSDEIVMLKKIDKNLVETIKKAKGLILEEEPHPEITALLRSFGIPTVVKKNHKMLYSTGDVISLNATTGEIKRGSMLVS